MFANTRNTVSMILGVAFAAATFAAPASAGQALSQNEEAAQAAIAGSPASLTVAADTSPAVLSRNEALAGRAIVDASSSGPHRDATGLATLAQNEIAAQHAIVDAAAPASARGAGASKVGVAAMRSPSQP